LGGLTGDNPAIRAAAQSFGKNKKPGEREKGPEEKGKKGEKRKAAPHDRYLPFLWQPLSIDDQALDRGGENGWMEKKKKKKKKERIDQRCLRHKMPSTVFCAEGRNGDTERGKRGGAARALGLEFV